MYLYPEKSRKVTKFHTLHSPGTVTGIAFSATGFIVLFTTIHLNNEGFSTFRSIVLSNSGPANYLFNYQRCGTDAGKVGAGRKIAQVKNRSWCNGLSCYR